MTNTGLKEFPEIKKLLEIDIEHLTNISQKENGHLGDIISGLKTTISSINLKVEKLKIEFKNQKNEH